jgi:DUF4097 and DUF4098 domain-containing protein YvlB
MNLSNRIKPSWWIFTLLILPLLAFATETLESAVGPAPAPTKEGPLTAFHSEIERDYNLRSIGQLQVTNLRGPIAVQGWAQDKIRVKAKRTVFASNAEEAKKLFSAIDFRYQETEGNIEFSGQYGQGLSIAERIRERARSADPAKTARMEMIVFAPSNLKLKVWASEGAVSVKGWNSDVELRSSSGEISGEQLKGSRVSCLCQSCEVHLRNARGSLRAMSQSGGLFLDDINAGDIYLESASGGINMQNTRADTLLLVTKTGSITGKSIQGNVEFHTQQGSVLLTGLNGFASGKSDSGNIEIQSHSWVFNDNALIESQKGNVTVSLPTGFAGDVDVSSKRGQAEVDFPLKRSSEPQTDPNHWVGRIGEEATDLLKIYSDSGNVKLVRSN